MSTVHICLKDIFGVALDGEVIFSPGDTPFFDGSAVAISGACSVRLDADGNGSVTLLPGRYAVRFSGITSTTDTLYIVVPNDEATYELPTLVIAGNWILPFRDFLQCAKNLADLADPAAAFAAIKQAATATASGVVQLATQAEVDAGSDPAKAITPATLASARSAIAYTLQSATFTAIAGGQYALDTTAGSFNVTIDAALAVGKYIDFADARGTWNTNPPTFLRNGHLIEGAASDYTNETQGTSLRILNVGGAKGLRVLEIKPNKSLTVGTDTGRLALTATQVNNLDWVKVMEIVDGQRYVWGVVDSTNLANAAGWVHLGYFIIIPQNTVAPLAPSGAYVGVPFVCTPGTWTDSPTSRGYQVQRSADGLTGWAAIDRATANTYTPVTGDIGYFLRFTETATNTAGTSVAVASNASGAVLASAIRSGLVLEYLFAPGTELADTSGNGATATNNNGVSFANSVATFDGTNYLTFDASALPTGGVDRTVSVVCNAAVVSSDVVAVAKMFEYGTEDFDEMIGLMAFSNPDSGVDNALVFTNYGNSVGGPNGQTGTRKVLTYVLKGGVSSVYIGGGLAQSGSPTITTTGASGYLGIGADLQNPFTGTLEKLRAWNRALTADEIATLAGGY